MRDENIPPQVQRVLRPLLEEPDDDAMFDILIELSESGTVCSAVDGGSFLIGHHYIDVILPSYAGEVRSQLDHLEEVGANIAGQFVAAPLAASGESAILVTRLPEPMDARWIIAGKAAGEAVSGRALELFCGELKKLAQRGEHEERAFDPTNWLYDTRAEMLALRHVTMPGRGEPNLLIAEINAFRQITTGDV